MAGSQESDLIPFLASQYNAIELARSIAEFGYFPSEPVIAIRERNRYVVVEGNRRLTALKLLDSEELRRDARVKNADEWEELAQSRNLPTTIPVIVVNSREAVAPIVGYRHISGIEPWDPWAKARFIADLIDSNRRRLTFEDAARLLGDRESDVRAHYRNYHIARQAREAFDIDTGRAEEHFGVFTRALNATGIRLFIRAPAPNDVMVGRNPLPTTARREAAELFKWLFGSDDSDAVIGESRDLTTLGRVLRDRSGLAELRRTNNLAAADAAAGGIKQRLLKNLSNAVAELQAAQQDIRRYAKDAEVRGWLRRCREQLRKLASGAANR